MKKSFIVVAILIALTPASNAQLLAGDVLIGTQAGYTFIRTGLASSVVPVGVGMTFVPTAFGNGCLLFVPGTNIILAGVGATTPFQLWAIDFSSSLTAPSAHLLGTTTGSTINMALDRATGNVFILEQTAPARIRRVSAPITPLSTIQTIPYATGLLGALAVAVLNNSQVVVGLSTMILPVNNGDTTTNPPLLTLAAAGMVDLDYDATNNRLLVDGFGNSRVDIYNLNSNTFVNTPLMSPQLFLCDAIDYDEVNDQIYALSRVSSTIGGAPYGVQVPGNDNVIVRVGSAGPSSTAVGVSPIGGHGNQGNNPYFALVKPVPQVVSGLQLVPNAATLTFNGGTGMVSATGTIQAVLGVPNVTNPAVDPLVGATVVMNAAFTGTDMSQLTDINLSAVNLQIFQTTPPPGMPNLTVTAGSSTNFGAVSTFGGVLSATPMATRRFILGAPAPTSSGGTSAALPLFAARVGAPGIAMTLSMQIGGVPYLSTIQFNPPNGITAFEVRHATSSGTGNYEMGVVRATPFAQIYNLYTTILSTPLGSGAFIGLAADSALFTQIGTPIGAQPFHVLADVNGQYHYTLPAGSIPPLSADTRTVMFVPPSTITLLSVQRITF